MGGGIFSKNPKLINLTRAINLGNQTVWRKVRVEYTISGLRYGKTLSLTCGRGPLSFFGA